MHSSSKKPFFLRSLHNLVTREVIKQIVDSTFLFAKIDCFHLHPVSAILHEIGTSCVFSTTMQSLLKKDNCESSANFGNFGKLCDSISVCKKSYRIFLLKNIQTLTKLENFTKNFQKTKFYAHTVQLKNELKKKFQRANI